MRDAKGLQSIDGFKYIASVPKGEVIIDMVSFHDNLYVTTKRHIYVLVDDKRLEDTTSILKDEE